MTLTPEVIEFAKKEVNLSAYYRKCDTVTAQHILFKNFTEGTKWGGLPKLIFYILLNDTFGMPRLKDANGDLGYGIELMISDKNPERSIATEAQ
jgi:hypothetical protein